jgi:drug/metabolite transporter (DMT)-like permease
MLILANLLWGLSFPTMKALGMAQQLTLPGQDSWFFASLCVVLRFGLAAFVMLLFTARSLKSITRLELWQGLGLGFFGGVGMLLQMDGLAHTEASTSAFLTQCYCLILPLWAAGRDRRWPTARVILSTALIVVGVCVLGRVDWRDFKLGRGEWETILASVIFTGQILWLERPKFAANRVGHFSLVMFAMNSLVCLPVALVTTQHAGDWVRAYDSAPTLGFLGILVLFCTLGAYTLMNRWQRHVGATLAGLLYCVEPVFASLFALWLPGLFSAWAGVNYPNETLTTHLLVGGGIITAANVLAQWPASMPTARGETERIKSELAGR